MRILSWMAVFAFALSVPAWGGPVQGGEIGNGRFVPDRKNMKPGQKAGQKMGHPLKRVFYSATQLTEGETLEMITQVSVQSGGGGGAGVVSGEFVCSGLLQSEDLHETMVSF